MVASIAPPCVLFLSGVLQTADRILSSYILYSMYAPHPISINPFATVLHAIFVRETNKALETERGGGPAENDQFVYVLWKILKGDGMDVRRYSHLSIPSTAQRQLPQIGPFSPQHILKHPIPPELRAVALVRDANTRSWHFNLYGSIFQSQLPHYSLHTQLNLEVTKISPQKSVPSLTSRVVWASQTLSFHLTRGSHPNRIAK